MKRPTEDRINIREPPATVTTRRMKNRDIPEYSINGSVQKGQFIQGSVVTIQELNERLPTDR